MKHAKTFLNFLLLGAMLSSCSIRLTPNRSSSSSESSSKEESSSITEESSSEPSSASESASSESSSDVESSSEQQSSSESVSSSSSKPEESSSEPSSSEESSVSSSSSSQEMSWNPDWNGTYTIYGVNDFHGSIKEQYNGSYYENGIKKYFGELKRRKEADPDHTIIISGGDMYQGSFESNDNHGKLVTEAMNAVPFDAMAVGNHEFDYGQIRLLENIELANFPVLAGNIMNWDGGPTDQRWDKVGLSTIIERNGMKIGIVGFIGQGQTTSITSKNVQNVTFVSNETIAKQEALRLRQQEGCQMVICSMHAPASEVKGVWSSEVSLKQYFDAFICAHTHKKDDTESNGVPFVQSYCNGEYYSVIKLKAENGTITSVDHHIEQASASWEEDETIAKLCEKYNGEEFQTKANRVAGTLTGTQLTKYTVANLGCKAIYEKYKPLHSDLALAMENSQRANVAMGEVTYSALYKASPFTNNIVIARVKGEDIKKEAGSNQTYTGDLETYGTINLDQYYTIAVIDYVLYHQNIYKVYDYFSSLNSDGYIIAEYPTFPMDLTYEYIHDVAPDRTINGNDYLDSLPNFGAYK